MIAHPFRISRSGNLVGCVSDASVLFTQKPEPEARALLSRHLTPEQIDELFSSYDETEFKRQSLELRNITRNTN